MAKPKEDKEPSEDQPYSVEDKDDYIIMSDDDHDGIYL